MTFDLNLSDDQRQILDAAATMLDGSYPLSRLRTRARDDLSDLTEFGAFTLALSEDKGGSGFTVVEEALLHVLFGRHVISTRALATSLALRIAAADLADKIASGAASVCAAMPSGDSILLVEPTGQQLAVLFTGDSLTLISLEGAAPEPVKSLGDGVPLGRLPAESATILSETTDPGILTLCDLLVSAQLLGIAEATRDLAVDYAKLRHQFGKPIGAFQAIKHHCANMAINAEVLSSLLDMTALSLAASDDDAEFQIAALRRLAPKLALENARTAIQIHGGIGFSDEADAHHFLKQAHFLGRLGSEAALLDFPAPLSPHREPEET
jgi:alkylation response protein AidB-like acyl-CoA dehydrogenase